MSLRGGVALAVEFATLGEVLLEEDQDRSSAGRLIGEPLRDAERRGTVTAGRGQTLADLDWEEVDPNGLIPPCGESRVRAPSREPRRRRPEPEPAFQFCLD
jgi:hypothetical protein